MKKLKLKSKRKKYKINILIIIIVVIVLCAFYFINLIGRKISNSIISISEIEAKSISKKIINQCVNDIVLKNFDVESLFLVEKNSSGTIEYIDFNSKAANELILLINKNVNQYITELNNGKSSLIDLKKNIVTSSNLLSNKEGIIFEIPIGIATNNSILSNLGPKIPIKVSILGDLDSEIKTSVENYGINNALVKINVFVTVTERMILPVITKDFDVSCEIPIAVRMVQGSIPNYYFDNFNQKNFS